MALTTSDRLPFSSGGVAGADGALLGGGPGGAAALQGYLRRSEGKTHTAFRCPFAGFQPPLYGGSAAKGLRKEAQGWSPDAGKLPVPEPVAPEPE